jgi:hypothetical protein
VFIFFGLDLDDITLRFYCQSACVLGRNRRYNLNPVFTLPNVKSPWVADLTGVLMVSLHIYMIDVEWTQAPHKPKEP